MVRPVVVDVPDRFQTHLIHHAERPQRHAHHPHPGPVHVLDAGHAGRHERHGGRADAGEHGVEHVAVALLAEHDGNLADAHGKLSHQLRHRRIRSRMRHDVRHVVGSQVVKMQREKFFRPAGFRGEFRGHEERRVGGKDRPLRAKFVELGEDRRLDLRILGHGFADQVRVARRLSRVGCRRYAAHDFLELFRRDPAHGNKKGGAEFFHALHGCLQNLVRDVIVGHAVAVHGAYEADLLAHGARAQNQHFFNVFEFHKFSLSLRLIFLCRDPIAQVQPEFSPFHDRFAPLVSGLRIFLTSRGAFSKIRTQKDQKSIKTAAAHPKSE